MTVALVTVLAILAVFVLWRVKRHNEKLWDGIGKGNSRIKCGGALPEGGYRFGPEFEQDPNAPVLEFDPVPEFLKKGLK